MTQISAKGYSYRNQVRLVPGGRAYFDTIEKLIDESKQLVFFQTYIFDDDTTGHRIASALMAAARRGVQVYLLLDGYASQKLPEDLIARLESAGLHFRWFEPLLRSHRFYAGRRLHHKVVTIDGLHAVVGGINISDRYNDLPGKPAWLDWAIHIQGEAVQELERICAGRATSRWSTRAANRFPLPVQSWPQEWACPVRIRVNDWVRGKMEISKMYHEMLRTCRNEIIFMSSYFLPGRDFRRQMRLAAKRGVRVRVILAGHSDVWLAKLAEYYLYPWLLRYKIEIWEYHDSVLHGKMAVADRQHVTIGSYNLNELSARASVELNAEVREASFGEISASALEEVITKSCRQVKNDDIHRKFYNRLLYGAAYHLSRLLLFLFTFYFRQHRRL